tara:strand:- start:1147 stop:1407 length:261 start_codon:yes stop_codon:yes gene_type:complete
MKKTILIVISIFFITSILQASTSCKKKYGGILLIKSYNKCVATEGTSGATNTTKEKKISTTRSTMEKVFGKINTDSTLLGTGKYSK